MGPHYTDVSSSGLAVGKSWVLFIMIAPTLVHVRGEEKEGGEEGAWRNLTGRG